MHFNFNIDLYSIFYITKRRPSEGKEGAVGSRVVFVVFIFKCKKNDVYRLMFAQNMLYLCSWQDKKKIYKSDSLCFFMS